MLVLSRKREEEVVIGNDISVRVLEIRGDKVRLGIVAPKSIPVHRREVFDQIFADQVSEVKKPAPRGDAAEAAAVDREIDHMELGAGDA